MTALRHWVNNMVYSAEKYIHSLLKFGVKPGLQRIFALCKALGNPQEEMKFIHVAGTNGKGSVCNMLSNIYISAGYRVGLFTSPYILDFRERIQVDGEMIPVDDLERITEIVKNASESFEDKPTEFEFITAMAFLYFKEQNCDIVVLETGLGGRLDSTNIIKAPLCSVLTSISYDHMNILGDTLEEIAAEKCGIIKEKCPVVLYPLQEETVTKLVKITAAEKQSTLTIPTLPKVLCENIRGTDIEYGTLKIHIPMVGKHQIYNTVTAVKTAQLMGIDNKYIVDGVEKTKVAARVEVLSENPLIIIDGGHNESGADALKYALESFVDKKIIAVSAMMKDKEFNKFLERIAPLCETFIATELKDNPRCLKAQELHRDASKYTNAVVEAEPERAAELAKHFAGKNKAIVICGSLYLASEIRKFF